MKDVKTVGEAREVLDAIGQTDEKGGIKWTQFFMGEWEREQAALQQKEFDLLEKAKKKGETSYIKAVADLLQRELVDLDLPLDYEWDVSHSSAGIVFRLAERALTEGKTIKGSKPRKWMCAFKPCQKIPVDYYAVIETLVRADTTVQNNGVPTSKKNGLFLP